MSHRCGSIAIKSTIVVRKLHFWSPHNWNYGSANFGKIIAYKNICYHYRNFVSPTQQHNNYIGDREHETYVRIERCVMHTDNKWFSGRVCVCRIEFTTSEINRLWAISNIIDIATLSRLYIVVNAPVQYFIRFYTFRYSLPFLGKISTIFEQPLQAYARYNFTILESRNRWPRRANTITHTNLEG